MSEAHEIASFRRRAQRSARTRSRVGTRLPPAPNGCDIQDAQGSTCLKPDVRFGEVVGSVFLGKAV